jgi:hypothetical protein
MRGEEILPAATPRFGIDLIGKVTHGRKGLRRLLLWHLEIESDGATKLGRSNNRDFVQ